MPVKWLPETRSSRQQVRVLELACKPDIWGTPASMCELEVVMLRGCHSQKDYRLPSTAQAHVCVLGLSYCNAAALPGGMRPSQAVLVNDFWGLQMRDWLHASLRQSVHVQGLCATHSTSCLDWRDAWAA